MRTWGLAGAGLVLGCLLWLGSSRFTGVAQPWSAPKPTYLVVLFFVGAALGAASPRSCFAGPLGLYLGQAFGLATQGYLVSPTDPPVIYPVALLFLGSYSLSALVGAAVAGAALRFYRGL